MSNYKQYFCQCIITLISTRIARSRHANAWLFEGWKVHRDAMGIPESVIEISVRRRMDTHKHSEGSAGDWNNVLYVMAKEFVDLYQIDPLHNHVIQVTEKTSWQTGDGLAKKTGSAAKDETEDKEEKSNIIKFPKHRVK